MRLQKHLIGDWLHQSKVGRDGESCRAVMAAIHDELRVQVTLVIVTTSTLNAAVESQHLLAHLASYMPPVPIVFPNVRRDLIEGVNIENWPFVDRFYRMLELARTDTPNSVVKRAGLRRAIMRKEDLIRLGSLWRGTTAAAIDALQEGEQCVAENPEVAAHSAKLLQLIETVRHGQSPCLQDGTPCIPECVQIRRHPRRIANVGATLRSKTTSARVLIADISQGGCGLDRVPELEPCTPVTLNLESGRTLRGTVQWVKGSRAGVQFHVPLVPIDPLVSGG